MLKHIVNHVEETFQIEDDAGGRGAIVMTWIQTALVSAFQFQCSLEQLYLITEEELQ